MKSGIEAQDGIETVSAVFTDRYGHTTCAVEWAFGEKQDRSVGKFYSLRFIGVKMFVCKRSGMMQFSFEKTLVVARFTANPGVSMIVTVYQRRRLYAVKIYIVYGKDQPSGMRPILQLDPSPGTAPKETVVLLSKGEIDSKKVRVEFSLEDMDMSGFQKGATYEQIKAYVLEHTGLKVSSLYISQIKRKCGLDVGQNYNLSKKEDAKVPKCPPEKEAAIRDALKYFQMI